MKIKRLICIITVISLVCAVMPAFAADEAAAPADGSIYEIYVALGGTGVGTEKSPVGDINQARALAKKAVRDMPGIDGVTVYFREGRYQINKTMEFTKEDSGREDCPIIYKAYPGEQVIFDGGISITGSAFTEVTDKGMYARLPKAAREYARVVDLTTIPGFTPFSSALDPNSLMLTYDLEKLQVSRWPNASWALTGEMIKSGADNKGIEFVVNDDRILNWKDAKNAWMIGMWKWEWGIQSFPVVSVNLESKTVAANQSLQFKPASKNKNWYIYNLIEELDIENEFYIDSENSKLYIYPYESDINDGSFSSKTVQIPVISKMLTMANTEYVEFQNIIMENMSGDVITMTDTRHCAIRGCTLRNAGGQGISLTGTSAYKCFIDSCHIYNLGARAVYCSAGDTVNVIKGECEIINNKIHNTEIANRTNQKTLALRGVGNRAAHNEIFNVPHIGLDIVGQQHVFEYNEMYDILADGAHDAGTLHAGRTSTTWHNTLRYNYFHDLNKNSLGVLYQDDMNNGLDMYGNVFYQTGKACFIHGGNYNHFRNNIIIHPLNTDIPGIQYGSCAHMTWDTTTMASDAVGTTSWNYTVSNTNAKEHYDSEIFRKTYPEFATMMESGKRDYPGGMVGNNVIVFKDEVPEGVAAYTVAADTPEGFVIPVGPNHLTNEDIGFVDMEKQNFALKEDAAIFDILPDFEDVHFEKMGRYESEYGAVESKIEEFDLVYPKDKAENISASEVTLIWKGQPDTRLHRVEIATDRDFKENVRTETLEGTQLTVKNLRYGKVRYYWRVTAIAQNSKAIDIGTEVPCSAEYFSFVTAESETIDYTDAEKLIESSKAVSEAAVEGSEPGQYFEGTKAELENTIAKMEKEFSAQGLSQKKLNAKVEELSAEFDKLASRRNPETITLDKALMVLTGWTHQTNRAYQQDLGGGRYGISWERSAGGDETVLCYKEDKIENYQTVKFNCKLDFPKPAWFGFGMRSSDTVSSFEQIETYLVILKPHEGIAELQKYGTGKFYFEAFPLEGVEFGKEFQVEFGAIDTEDGNVRVTFKVNGETVIDYLDTEYQVKNPGHFAVYMPSGNVGNKLWLMPARDIVAAAPEEEKACLFSAS